jgi:hypothetical protein
MSDSILGALPRTLRQRLNFYSSSAIYARGGTSGWWTPTSRWEIILLVFLLSPNDERVSSWSDHGSLAEHILFLSISYLIAVLMSS